MLAMAVRDLLNADATLVALLPGGMYPTPDHPASSLSRRNQPAAFDAAGRVLPTLLVQDDGTQQLGSTSRTGRAFVRILLWQQEGTATIEEAQRLSYLLLNEQSLRIAGAIKVYRFSNVGDGPQLRDPGVQDAEHRFSRWQADFIREG